MKHSFLLFCAMLISMTNSVLLAKQEHVHVPLKNSAPTLLILDTEGKDRYYYRNTELLAKSVGFKPSFKNFYQWLEEPSLANYHTIIFFLSGTFLKHKETVLIQRVFTALKEFNKRQDTHLAVLLPGGNSNPENIAPHLEQLCAELDIIDYSQETATAITTKAFIRFCMRPDSKVGFTYNSTLINQTNPSIEPWKDPLTLAGYSNDSLYFQNNLTLAVSQKTNCSNSQIPATNTELQLLDLNLLPSAHEYFSAKASLFLPAGLLIRNPQNNKVSLLAKASSFNFADVEENFFRCPINVNDRNELLHIAQHLLWDFHNACSSETTLATCPALPSLFLPTTLKANKQRAEQKIIKLAPDYRWIAQGDCSAGWLAPDDYHLSREKFEGIPEKMRTELKKKALQVGVAFLYDADINLLWFELNAENFLSKLVRSPEKEAELRQQIQPIVDELIRQALINKKPLPKIFIGTDITCNFRRTLPKYSVVDIFGATYSKIPSPLERATYWKQELLDVFDAFCDLFEKTIPIDGIFLDFEMYHAQDQAGGYDNLMDFSNTSWQVFCKQKELQNNKATTLSSPAKKKRPQLKKANARISLKTSAIHEKNNFNNNKVSSKTATGNEKDNTNALVLSSEKNIVPTKNNAHKHISSEEDTAKKITCLTSTEERVSYLCKNHLFGAYFTCLEQEARAIGTMIKNHLRARLPNLMIGAYATTLPGSWFYRGMFAGLSDKQHPLILATFNMDVYSHLAWMREHSIYYLHGAPLLLSKLALPEDISLIDYLATYHSFIWFSRPSRIVYDFEKHKDAWWSVEASKLDRALQASMFKNARKKTRAPLNSEVPHLFYKK